MCHAALPLELSLARIYLSTGFAELSRFRGSPQFFLPARAHSNFYFIFEPDLYFQHPVKHSAEAGNEMSVWQSYISETEETKARRCHLSICYDGQGPLNEILSHRFLHPCLSYHHCRTYTELEILNPQYKYGAISFND